MRIAAGADHAGYELKQRVVAYLRGRGHDVEDLVGAGFHVDLDLGEPGDVGLRRAVPTVVIARHAARNGLIPVITVVGLSFGDLLAGAVITETVFSWPGIGSYAFSSATSLDFPAILGVGVVVALIYVFVNLFVDIAYALVDPRIRVG